MAGTFKIELVSPERVLLSGEATEVVVPGLEGDFTVLAGHAPVISALRPGILDIRDGSSRRRIYVRGGFADVTPAGLTILAEEAIRLSDVDAAALGDVRDRVCTLMAGAAELKVPLKVEAGWGKNWQEVK